MAILELTVNQEYAGQLLINRYHFVASGTPAAVSHSFGLMAATGYLTVSGTPLVFPSMTVADRIQAVTVSGLRYVSAYARNLYDPLDFYERPYVAPVYGLQSGVGSSPTLAFGIQSNRVRTDVRRGNKRYGGVREEALAAGGAIEASALGPLTQLCDILSAPLTYDDEGSTLTYTSAVLSYEDYPTPSGRTAYRPYATEATQLSHAAVGVAWAPVTTVRTQVSRQYGRGA